MVTFELHKILVAVDFTETSDLAVEHAIALAKRSGGSVVLMHAYEMPIYGFPDGALIASGDVAARISDAAQSALDALVAKYVGEGVELRGLLRNGPPWEEANSVAESEKADLIVIGTHGRKGLARALLGSVAEKIIRTANHPVLTIRGPA